MRSFKDQTIKTKLVVIITFAGIISLVAGLVTYLVFDMLSIKQEMKKNAILNANLVAQYSVVPLLFDYKDEARDVLAKLDAIPSVLDACIFNANNEIFASYHRNPDEKYSFQQNSKTKNGYSKGFLYIYHPVNYEGKNFGTLFFRISAAAVNEKLVNNLLVMVILILILIFPVIIIANRLQKVISSPVLKLAELTASISQNQDFTIQLEAQGNDEVGILYNQFNKMLSQLLKWKNERDHAEKELIFNSDHLEELVKMRTAELEREKENAQSADKLKSAFLATMSHELRTPLNSIIGFTGILMQEHPGPLNSEQKKQLGMAQQSARHLLSLINDILDISKIEAGQLQMNIHTFNLPDLINKVSETMNPFAEKKNLRLITSINTDIQDITSDKLRIQQILLNLVNNAIKFTESGSVSIECSDSDQSFTVRIIDTGIGIEEKQMDNLFKPFSQIDTGLSRKHEGSGLGLSICKKLLELLNGSIEVESESGKGSTFTVKFPISN
ncbi:MAG: ATP-binding protein [Bacteroidetes bacterium]|nr:ATP-binding protein [Bacteroidota bacterium]